MARAHRRFVLALGLVLGSAPGWSRADASTGVQFIALGDLEGGAFRSHAVAISADGAQVFGASVDASGARAVRWSEVEGMRALAGVPLAVRAASDDGTVLVGVGAPSAPPRSLTAFRWTSSEGVKFLGDLPGGPSLSEAFDVSADGSVVVGLGAVPPSPIDPDSFATEAFRWTPASGMIGLGVLPGTVLSEAHGVSADGSVVVGQSGGPLTPPTYPWRAFRWTAATGLVALSNPAGGSSAALGVSPDGRVIFGWSESGSRKEAVLWTEAGQIVHLGTLVTSHFCCDASLPLAASFDGSVIVGTTIPADDTSPIQAFLWDADRGLRSLAAVLETSGLDLAGWSLTRATAISYDGRSIAGNGLDPEGNEQAWLTVFPPADGDADGVADADDECPQTAPGEAVDPARGCSVSQLCPCAGPRDSSVRWASYGRYLSCVTHTASRFFRRGWIDRPGKRSLIREAATSSCGRRSRH